jgi:hypothetical protein
METTIKNIKTKLKFINNLYNKNAKNNENNEI